jgi:hypothetical protein
VGGDVVSPPAPQPPLEVPIPLPVPLHAKAEDNLRFIRETMERAGSFTALSGWGQVVIGVTAGIAALLASRVEGADRWLAVWLGEATLATAISMATTSWKTRDARIPLMSGPARKFALSFVPTMAAGAALTVVLVSRQEHAMLPAIWMLLYGAAVVSAGTFSVPSVPVMGICFMLCGVVALLVPSLPRDVLMASTFGGLHVLFGVYIARRHGG